MRSRWTPVATVVGLLVGAVPGSAAQQPNGGIFISGTDASGHDSPGDPDYLNSVFGSLRSHSSRPAQEVLVLGSLAPDLDGITVPYASVGSLAAVDLDDYSALYVTYQTNAAVDGFQAPINSFIAGGGFFGIELYTEQLFYEAILGFSGGLAATTEGYESPPLTPAGAAFGLVAPSVPVGSWGHAVYSDAFLMDRGYVELLDRPAGWPDLPDPGESGAAFALISTRTVVPEPMSLLLLATGLLGIGAARRIRR